MTRVIALILLLTLAQPTLAVMQNNTDTINLDPLISGGSGGGDEEEPEDPGPTDPGTGGGTEAPPETPPTTPPATGGGEVVIIVGAPPTTGDSSTSTPPTTPTNPAPTITETLVESGAVGGTDASGGTAGQGGIDEGDDGVDWSGSSGGLYISGDKVRESLTGLGLSRIVIRGWDPVTKTFITVTEGRAPGGTALARNNEELGLIAASASMEDERLGQILINGSTLDLEYRTSGRILFIIPRIFMLRIHVDASQSSPETRVQLTYPWYYWMLWPTVPRSELIATLDAAITESQANTTDTKDAEARLFIGVSAALKRIHSEYERGIRILL